MALFLSKLSMQSKAGLRFFGSFSGHNQSFLGGQVLASNNILASLPMGGDNKSQSVVVENTDMLMDRLFSRQMQMPHAVGSAGNLDASLPSALNEIIGDDLSDNITEISVMNRNARKSRKANHGARPCSRMSRRHKKNQIGKRRRHA